MHTFVIMQFIIFFICMTESNVPLKNLSGRLGLQRAAPVLLLRNSAPEIINFEQNGSTVRGGGEIIES